MVESRMCYVAGCREAVTGQCGCGHDYCGIHASDGLCLRCLERRVLRDNAERACGAYAALAKAAAPRGLGWSLLVAVILASVPVLLSLVVQNTACLIASFGSPLVLAPLLFFADRARSQRQLRQAAQGKPGFAEFYQAWRARSSHERLLSVLESACAGGQAGAARD